MSYTQDYEDLSYEECFQRIFGKLDLNDKIINELNNTIHKQNEEILFLTNENKLLNNNIHNMNVIIDNISNQDLVIIQKDIQEVKNKISLYNSEFSFFQNVNSTLEEVINDIKFFQDEVDITLEDKIVEIEKDLQEVKSDMNNNLLNTQIIDIKKDMEVVKSNMFLYDNIRTTKSTNELSLLQNNIMEKINYSYLNENKYYILIDKLKMSLELENWIFKEIKESRYLPIENLNKYFMCNKIWYYINEFTTLEILKIHFKNIENMVLEQYNFDITMLFSYNELLKNNPHTTNPKEFLLNYNKKVLFYGSNGCCINRNKKSYIDLRIESGRPMTRYLPHQELFSKTFENHPNDYIVRSIDYEYKNDELENLLLESYERYECLKLIKNNQFDINLS